MKFQRRRIVVITVAVIFLAGLILNWPPVSKEKSLTGLSFEMLEVAFFDDTGIRGEGHRIWIYRIPDREAERLSADRTGLSDYPMWSALAFDGYKQFRWSDVSSEHTDVSRLVLKSVFNDAHGKEVSLDDIDTIGDARDFARKLALLEGTLVAGWYTTSEAKLVSNYFVYVMNLEERVLVKLSLLT